MAVGTRTISEPVQPESWVPLQLVIHRPQFSQGVSFVGSVLGGVSSGQATPDGSRTHPRRGAKAFPAGKAFLWVEREGTRQACSTVQDRGIKTRRGRPNLTPGAAWRGALVIFRYPVPAGEGHSGVAVVAPEATAGATSWLALSFAFSRCNSVTRSSRIRVCSVRRCSNDSRRAT